MPDINLVDTSLKNYYEKTEISIQVSPDGFSFCIYSSEDKVLRGFRLYKFSNTLLQEDLLNNTDEVLHKDELLRLPHQKVRVCYVGRKSTILPEGFADQEKYKQILEFNQPIDDLDEVHRNKLHTSNAELIFAVPTYFASLMADKFTQVYFYNQATPLMHSAIEYCKDEGSLVCIQLNNSFFDLVIVQEGSLKLYNSFLYANTTDLLYFILYAGKQLHADLKNTPSLIVGEQTSNSTLTTELLPYLKTRIQPESTVKQKVSVNLKPQYLAQFHSLLNLIVCE